MTDFLAPPPRRAIERLHRRHVADVYRYALALLADSVDAADVTRTTFADAYLALGRGARPTSARRWLTSLAHELCRQRAGATAPVPAAFGALAPGAVETLTLQAWLGTREGPEAPLACDEAERALSLQLDDALPARQAARLRAHVQACPDCAAFDRSQRAQRRALRALARVPLPPALATSEVRKGRDPAV